MNLLFITTMRHGHGAFSRQVMLASALAETNRVFWMGPTNPIGESVTHIPCGVNQKRNFGIFGPLWNIYLGYRQFRPSLAKIDCAITFREYDMAASLLVLPFAWQKVWFSRGDAISIQQFHQAHSNNSLFKIKNELSIYLLTLIHRYIFAHRAAVVFQAEFLRDRMVSRLKIIRASLSILPNHCYLPGETLSASVDQKLSSVRHIAMIAPIYLHAKGVDDFIALADRARETSLQFHVYGDGPDLDHAKAIAARRGLSNIEFHGWIEGIESILLAIDILIVPTKLFDACPNVVLEALQYERAILASDIEAHQNLLDSNQLYPAGNLNALYEKLKSLIDDDIALNNNIALSRKAKDRYSFDWAAKAMLIINQVSLY